MMAEPRNLTHRLMGRLKALAIVVPVVLAVNANPVLSADPVRLKPDDIVERIERAGYGYVSRLRQRGDVYTADAMTKNGLPVHIVVNAASGAIVGLRYIDRTLVGAPNG